MKLTLNAEIIEKKQLRAKRVKLLEAFDIYKSNVTYGTITETEAEHEAVVEWYHDLLDLVEEAFDCVPRAVARYVK